MATHITKPITHIFKEINEGKYKSVKHYELIEVRNGTTFLSNSINISKDRNCAKSNPDYWLKIREGKKWSKNITGLFKVKAKLTYKGDDNHRQNLIIFKFSEGARELTAYYFKDYFTTDLSNVLGFINK